jgi:hypothetical protein
VTPYLAASAFAWMVLAIMCAYRNDTAPRTGLERSGLWLVIGTAMAVWSAHQAAQAWGM